LPAALPASHSVQQMLTFFGRTLTKRTDSGQRQTIQHEDYNCHVYRRADGLCGVVAADMDYPQRVAFVFLSKLMEEFGTEFAGRWEGQTEDDGFAGWPNMARAIAEYQDPAKADKITAIQKELEDTTAILHKTIDGVLERGVKLDQLVDKSNDLSNQSKMFYKQARKTNSCCVIC
jgi:synaptobrevin family protein YKT6